MHRVVPEFIVEQYRKGNYTGEFQAVGLFLDLSGFSTMTDVLMQHGQHGAEVLAGMMHSVFDPLVESIVAYGGFVVGFAGDSIMALYPAETDLELAAQRAVASALLIQQRFQENSEMQTVYGSFTFSAKIGLAGGMATWGILRSRDGDQATYYFRGSAVAESAYLQKQTPAGQILISPDLQHLLDEQVITDALPYGRRLKAYQGPDPGQLAIALPEVDVDQTSLFMPRDVITNDIRPEFRQIVNLFLRIPDVSHESLQRMMWAVFELKNKYGGLVSRIDFGDKGCNLLMLWGAPVTHGNDIGRALNFVLDLRSRLDFPITAGITYYISHAGYLGSSIYEDYTCYGWGVNLAARFMMAAQPGEIWVDDRISIRVSNWFDISFLNRQAFKGFAAEQKVYALQGKKPTSEPTYAGELVGREPELDTLASFIQPIWDGRFAGLMLIVGEAGIGKGHLVYELRTSKRFEGQSVLWAICRSDQILRNSFNSLRSWLLRYFGIIVGQSAAERRQSFDTKLDELLRSISDPDLERELQRTRSVLAALVEIEWQGSFYNQLDPESRYNNTFLALINLFKAESRRRPVILFIEDLQFVDADTIEFLGRLKRAIAATNNTVPISILVTARPPALGLNKDWIDQWLLLRGLEEQDISYLAQLKLGNRPAPELAQFLIQRSEGNPYFIEQIIRYLQEEKKVEFASTGWQLASQVESAFLPGDIRSVLMARLDQLDHKVRESVQTAAVLGQVFEVQVLNRIWEGDPQTQSMLQEAEKAAVLLKIDNLRYSFSHGLLRDSAYEMQTQARRRELHRAALGALEEIYGGNIGRYAELAHHAKYAELDTKAQKYYTLAAQAAADAFQNQQAVGHYQRALAFVPRDDFEGQFQILFERAKIYNRLGNRSAELNDVLQLEALASKISKPALIAKAKMLYAAYCYAMGDYAGTVEFAEQVIDLSRRLEDLNLALGVYSVWAHSLFRLGRTDDALQHGQEHLALARQMGKRVEEGIALSSIGLMMLESKEPTQAHVYLEAAVEIARETKYKIFELRTLGNLANSSAYTRRDYPKALEYYEQAYSLSVDTGDRVSQGHQLSNIGWVSGILGDFERARFCHAQALEISREVGNIYQETYTLMNLSGVADAQNNAEDAVRFALQARELVIAQADKQGEAWAMLYLGHAYLSNGLFVDAQLAFERSLTLRQELDQPALATEPIAGLIHVALKTENRVVAMAWAEKLLSYLAAGGSLEGTEEPLRIYLSCLRILEKEGDLRFADVLKTAMTLLNEQVSRIEDAIARRRYIDNVPWRRAIEQAWSVHEAK